MAVKDAPVMTYETTIVFWRRFIICGHFCAPMPNVTGSTLTNSNALHDERGNNGIILIAKNMWLRAKLMYLLKCVTWRVT